MAEVKCMNPWMPQSIRQYSADGIWPALPANSSGGQNRSGVCYAIDQQGGKNNAGYAEGVMMTLCSDSHGTPHGVCYALEGNTVDRKSNKNGRGWCEDVSPTLNTQDKHAVVFTIDADSSNSMKSANPNSGIHETEVAKCLDTMCLNPQCNQGGARSRNLPGRQRQSPVPLRGGYSESGQSYTLNTIERHSVCYAVDCRNGELNREKSATLQAKGQGGWSVNVTNPVLMENEP